MTSHIGTYIRDGAGFDVYDGGANFTRAQGNTPIEVAPTEFARKGHVIGYIAGSPSSIYGFMRAPRVRVHVRLADVANLD